MAPGLQLCPLASGIALVLPNGSCICPVTMDLNVHTVVLFLHTPLQCPCLLILLPQQPFTTLSEASGLH